MSFYRENEIAKTRKKHFCLGCEKSIQEGQTATYCAGMSDGDFWSGHFHPDCRKAEIEMNAICGHTGDEWHPVCMADEFDMLDWLLEKHPTVHERICK